MSQQLPRCADCALTASVNACSARAQPPYAVLRAVPARRWPAIFEDWDHLSAYRHVDRWWGIGAVGHQTASQ